MNGAAKADLLRNVSRETADMLQALADDVTKWTARVNLIAPGTLQDIWTRHIVDSAQIFHVAPVDAKTWLDIGSGGGFPGLVVAIMAKGEGRDLSFTLIESDRRKAAFLSTFAHRHGLNVTVKAERVETAASLSVDVLSARALAPLAALCVHAERHLSSKGLAIFPKGQGWQDEVQAARADWHFDWQAVPSTTDPSARIVILKDIRRR